MKESRKWAPTTKDLCNNNHSIHDETQSKVGKGGVDAPQRHVFVADGARAEVAAHRGQHRGCAGEGPAVPRPAEGPGRHGREFDLVAATNAPRATARRRLDSRKLK